MWVQCESRDPERLEAKELILSPELDKERLRMLGACGFIYEHSVRPHLKQSAALTGVVPEH